VVEEGMGDALDEEKERRQQLAGVRREARAAVARNEKIFNYFESF
jgi:hypothetical protein